MFSILFINSGVLDAVCNELDLVVLKNFLILFACYWINRIIINFIAEKFLNMI